MTAKWDQKSAVAATVPVEHSYTCDADRGTSSALDSTPEVYSEILKRSYSVTLDHWKCGWPLADDSIYVLLPFYQLPAVAPPFGQDGCHVGSETGASVTLPSAIAYLVSLTRDKANGDAKFRHFG
ncbi:hypothetical protein BV898_06371 [Hypsibius exemplaris]|uniref:Uncharacterized protein n=1 Tax=Hypsibius exemplaris TaxID=2072580 RepID=A0A1W0WWN1_HYPEX|nr:hypothetical protein BV898_06371 [Hypsibius exemplaris]